MCCKCVKGSYGITSKEEEEKNKNKSKGLGDLQLTSYRLSFWHCGEGKKNIPTTMINETFVIYKCISVSFMFNFCYRLMMERIKWAEESRSKDAELESKCQLVWEGVVSDRSFGEVRRTFVFFYLKQSDLSSKCSPMPYIFRTSFRIFMSVLL